MAAPPPFDNRGHGASAPKQHGMTDGGKGTARDDFGNSMIITQVMRGKDAVVEMCGCDVKNKYLVETVNRQFYISEESDCLERVCCGPQRSLTFRLHDGPTDGHPILYQFRKPCHCQALCCASCRPKMTVLDTKGNMIGRAHDPWRCCVVDNFIYDTNNTLSYIIHGTACQIGLCCPCSSARFEIKHAEKTGNAPGMLTKKFNGLQECCVQANKFVIDFPVNTPPEHKALIMGSTMLVDLQYFEKKQ
eukprot:GEMP01082537.1.p1 GENE.GEMP01082537.1~~GEMP01082537.1.p1  ORF type:complete len:247 (+),score=52.36 GEMP01082537.1:171-911(+)